MKKLKQLAGVLFVVLLVAFVPSVRAQQAATPVVKNSPASADEMQIFLVAHDKKGRPVSDLKPDELSVTDDGSPVKLDDFRFVNGNQQPPQLVTFVFDRSVTEESRDHNKKSSKILSARDAAGKILEMLPKSGFELSVFKIDSRLRLVQDFTADRSVLDKSVDTATEKAPSGQTSKASATEKALITMALSGKDSNGKVVAARQRLLAQSMYAALKNSSRIAQDRHIAPSLSSLLALVQSQQDLPGRRTLVYLSWIDQARIDDKDRKAIESIIGSANEAGVSIDVIDCSALGQHGSKIKTLNAPAQGALVDMNTMRAGGGSVTIAPDQSTLQVWEDAPVDADLKHLAEATGGTYFNGESQRKVIEQLVGDMATYYEASFVPRIKDYDGKFHPVEVKSLRKGLKIRTQTGYLALPPRAEDGSRPQPFELPLLKLLKQSPLPSELPFRAAILDMGDRADGRMSVLAIEVPIENLDIQKDANSPTSMARLTMVAYARDETGAIAAHFSSRTEQRLAIDHAGVKSISLISLQRHFELPAGKYSMEVLVRDDKSGKTGAQRIPFEISDTAGAPSLGNLLLVRHTDPVQADNDPADPLLQGKERVTPELTNTLAPGVAKVSVFFAGHAEPHAAQAAKLEIKVLRDGQVLGGEPLVSRQVSGEEYFSYLTSFSINPAKDGTYQVEAFLTQGGKTAETQTSFTLTDVGPAGPDTSDETENLETTARPSGPLAITIPANPIQRPSDDELKALIADATHYAEEYWNSLPNFICDDVTERFVSSHGKGNWKHRDTLTGTLTYFDHREDWKFVVAEVNHHKKRENTKDTEQGIFAAGIFGGVIRDLFRPESKAEIVWTETGALGEGTVQVFKYRVARENSHLNLRVGPNDVITVGYHGLVYVDSTTHGVRRITEVADDIPAKFPIRALLVSADYDYVSIGDQNYLVPIGAQIVLGKGRNEMDLNQIKFQNFHRFRSSMKIITSSPSIKQ